MTSFDAAQFLPDSVYHHITEIRLDDPDCAFHAAQQRQRPDRLTRDGHLNIVAADHPGRRATRVGEDPLRMANRRDLLARLVRILAAGGADGLLAAMDTLEELLILDHLLQQAGGPSFLDQRVLIASLNRGGLEGAAWELDDAWTGPDAETCHAWKLDAGKALWRVVEDDPGSHKTMLMCAQAIRDLEEFQLPMFLEPLPVVFGQGKYTVVKQAAALAPLVCAAAALGNSSRYLWLKLPACENFEMVARATTLPMVILGGEVAGDQLGFFGQIADSLAAGANVRGTMIGRNVLYPADNDPLGPALAIQALVHERVDVAAAASLVPTVADVPCDTLTRWFG